MCIRDRLLAAPEEAPPASVAAKSKAKSAPRRVLPRAKMASSSAVASATMLPGKPRKMAELSASLAPVLERISSRLSQLEQSQQVPAVSAPSGVARAPQVGVAEVAQLGARCPPPMSLLSPSRCGAGAPQLQGMTRGMAGPRAYQENVAEARRLLTGGVGPPRTVAGLAEGMSTGHARLPCA
eukprot:3664245-Amphidinium_carterae.2